uniref:TSC-22/dip/bun family protein n=1 Tax=Wuchereria bancrofti TaxID=6293 RepID=A0A1I8ECQ5_WUCBA
MVFLRSSPPTSPSTCCVEYARIVSMKELDSSLAILCNYSQSTSKAQRRQTIASCMSGMLMTNLATATTFDNQSGTLITPPTTPDTAQGNAVHRWSASSISSISSRGSAKIQPIPPSLYTSHQSSSSTSSSLGFGEMPDKPNPKISTSSSNVFLDFVEVMRAATNTSTTGQNVVPIDNKIEQAMDLVKTHLTFAVREEVEILRSTIVELEAKQSIILQNVSVSVQGTQKQSMPAMTSDISVGPTSFPVFVPPVGLLSELQPGIEQKQSKQLSAIGSITDSDLQ